MIKRLGNVWKARRDPSTDLQISDTDMFTPKDKINKFLFFFPIPGSSKPTLSSSSLVQDRKVRFGTEPQCALTLLASGQHGQHTLLVRISWQRLNCTTKYITSTGVRFCGFESVCLFIYLFLLKHEFTPYYFLAGHCLAHFLFPSFLPPLQPSDLWSK